MSRSLFVTIAFAGVGVGHTLVMIASGHPAQALFMLAGGFAGTWVGSKI